MENTLVSIIIPVFNSSNYLDNCLTSVINQKYKNIEIILIDDGSTDNSLEICEKYKKNDKRITIISKENGGPGSCRNVGLKASHGSFITFVDSDDYVKPDYISTLLNYASSNKVDLVISGCIRCDEKGNKYHIEQYSYDTGLFDKKNIFSLIGNFDKDNVIYSILWAKLYKREVFNSITFPHIKSYEDEYIIHHIYNNCNNIILSIPYCGYQYINRNNSLSKNIDEKMFNCFWAFYDRYIFFKNNGYKKLAKNTIRHSCVTIINILEHLDYVNNAKSYNKAIRKLFLSMKIRKYYFIIPIKVAKNIARRIRKNNEKRASD